MEEFSFSGWRLDSNGFVSVAGTIMGWKWVNMGRKWAAQLDFLGPRSDFLYNLLVFFCSVDFFGPFDHRVLAGPLPAMVPYGRGLARLVNLHAASPDFSPFELTLPTGSLSSILAQPRAETAASPSWGRSHFRRTDKPWPMSKGIGSGPTPCLRRVPPPPHRAPAQVDPAEEEEMLLEELHHVALQLKWIRLRKRALQALGLPLAPAPPPVTGPPATPSTPPPPSPVPTAMAAAARGPGYVFVR